MAACLPFEEGAQVWDDRAHIINLDGAQGRGELASACAEVWLAAFRTYYTDAQAAMRGIKSADPEALDDLTGSQCLIANLSDPIGADPDRVAAAFIEALDAGRRFDTSAMNRPVPEIRDDLRGLDKWRDKYKRKGKPEAISLR